MPRPLPRFKGFLGQRNAVRYLQRICDGASQCGVVPKALLINGPPGHGKTALARAAAAAFIGCDRITAQYQYHPVLPSWTSQTLHDHLRRREYGDVLVLDEAHNLSRQAQELLYQALDARKIPVMEKNQADGSQLASVAEFWLILLTNEPHRLFAALRSRLDVLELVPYRLGELKVIVKDHARELGIEMTAQAAGELARHRCGSPRPKAQGRRTSRERSTRLTLSNRAISIICEQDKNSRRIESIISRSSTP